MILACNKSKECTVALDAAIPKTICSRLVRTFLLIVIGEDYISVETRPIASLQKYPYIVTDVFAALRHAIAEVVAFA